MVLGADGSSWFWVIGPLKAEGAKVFAAPLQQTSLADDVAALDRTLGAGSGSSEPNTGHTTYGRDWSGEQRRRRWDWHGSRDL